MKSATTRSISAVDFRGRDHFVADEAALGAVAVEAALHQDRLAREALAGEAREAQIGGAGDDALLARRQGHVGIARRHDVVHGEQHLAAAADREAIDRGDPRLLDRAARDLVGALVRLGDAAHELVDDAHVALQEPHERDLAAIEMGQVDAGVEDAPAAPFRMLHLGAAQHRDVARAIERRHIDRAFERIERGLVLGVEEARVRHRHMDGAGAPLDQRRAEIEPARGRELARALDRFRARQQHGVAEMGARLGVGEDGGQENSVVDFDSVFLALDLPVLAYQLGARRRQAGHAIARPRAPAPRRG